MRAERISNTSLVIRHGYCVGCGACAVVAPDKYRMYNDEYGRKQASAKLPSDTENDLADLVCPFSDRAENESQLSRKLFDGLNHDKEIGYYSGLWAGHAVEGDFRANGSSGGLVSWLIAELFDLELIDFVVHVKRSDGGPLFEYGVSTSRQEALAHTKSKYYPISIDEACEEIKRQPGRGLFVGIPCFVKALRNICLHDKQLSSRIAFMVGLVCGHLKSSFFADSFAWQLGVHPKDLASIDFRYMLPSHGGAANQYYVKVEGMSNGVPVTRIRQSRELFGAVWGEGFFKYKACDYCDDIFAESADICFGDAWIKPYVDDPRGHNIVVARNPILRRILISATERGKLKLDVLSPCKLKDSQAAGIRHRRDGVTARVKFKRILRQWTPRKRFVNDPYVASDGIRQRLIYVYREWMSTLSLVLFRLAVRSNRLGVFTKGMRPVVFVYNRVLYARFGRFIRKLRRRLLCR